MSHSELLHPRLFADSAACADEPILLPPALPDVSRVAVFASSGLSPVSLAIRYFTRPRVWPWPLALFNHVGFLFESATGERQIHEALLTSG